MPYVGTRTPCVLASDLRLQAHEPDAAAPSPPGQKSRAQRVGLVRRAATTSRAIPCAVPRSIGAVTPSRLDGQYGETRRRLAREARPRPRSCGRASRPRRAGRRTRDRASETAPSVKRRTPPVAERLPRYGDTSSELLPGQDDQRARPAHDRECGEQRDLGPELGRAAARSGAPRSTRPPRHRRGGRYARRDRLRVGDHEEEEDEQLGRGHQHPPEIPAGDRPEVPARRHRVAARGEHPDARREHQPEEDGDPEQPQPRRITKPPVTMIASASTIHADIGPHQKSSGSARLRSEHEEEQHETDVRGLKTCRPRKRMRYFESRETAAVPAKIHQPRRLHQSPCSVPGTRRMKATPFPVRSALAGHMITCWRRNAIANSSTAHVSSETRIWAIESWNSNATWPSTCSETITAARCSRGSRATAAGRGTPCRGSAGSAAGEVGSAHESRRRDSNPRPTDYKSVALPAELLRLGPQG